MAKILVVDDEATLVETLTYNLKREGYDVVTAESGPEAVQRAETEKPDLIILDVMLPGLDGFGVCRAVRQYSSAPVIMLTAKDDEVDKVVGLEIGADDYMTKPFSLRELLARVKASLRRVDLSREEGRSSVDIGAGDEQLRSGNLIVDVGRHEVSMNGSFLSLKPKEFDLLAYLVMHRGKAVTRDQLLERVWGYDYPGDTRTVDVHVRWLREKIEQEPSAPKRILTVRNVGYKFEG